MQHFLERGFIRKLEQKLKKTKIIFLFLDYDGTLTSIHKKPELALLPPLLRKTLKNLSSFPQVVLTIISGRALHDLVRLININNINYGGNHGLELKTDTRQDEILQAEKIRKNIASFCEKIKKRAQNHNGVFVENKGLTATIHYRMANPKTFPELKEIVRSVLSPLKEEYELRGGKKVLELKPKTKRNKGWALEKIIHLYNPDQKLTSQYFYLGDDLTDEDAFELINLRRGHSILVGRKRKGTKAKYYLTGPKEVHSFLTWMKERLAQREDKIS